MRKFALIIDLLQKIFWRQKSPGDRARKTAVYLDIHEDLSTGSTTQICARGAFAASLILWLPSNFLFSNGIVPSKQEVFPQMVGEIVVQCEDVVRPRAQRWSDSSASAAGSVLEDEANRRLSGLVPLPSSRSRNFNCGSCSRP